MSRGKPTKSLNLTGFVLLSRTAKPLNLRIDHGKSQYEMLLLYIQINFDEVKKKLM